MPSRPDSTRARISPAGRQGPEPDNHHTCGDNSGEERAGHSRVIPGVGREELQATHGVGKSREGSKYAFKIDGWCWGRGMALAMLNFGNPQSTSTFVFMNISVDTSWLLRFHSIRQKQRKRETDKTRLTCDQIISMHDPGCEWKMKSELLQRKGTSFTLGKELAKKLGESS